MSEISFNTSVPQVDIVVTPSGMNGRDGRDGRDGVDGTPGRDGADGAPGRNGIDGKDGVDGAPGRDGVDGVGIKSVTVDAHNHLMLTFTDDTVQDAGLLDTIDPATLETISRLEDIRTVRANAPSNRGTEPYDGAVLTFTDDDGTLRFLTEHVPVYRKHGVTATTAVVASRAITTSGITTSGDPYEAMSFEQLRALAREGFDIQSHTWSHARNVFNSGYNQNVTDAEIDQEYRLADEAFRQNGFDCNCMVFPWGAHQDRHLALARRYARFGVNCRGMDGMNDATTDPMDLNRLTASTNGSNIAQLKAAIDTAIARKCWLIILTHAGATQPDAASLDALLTYAQEKGIRIENFREAARMKAPAYYAGVGDTAFRVMPNGETSLSLSDIAIERLIARAYELGFISPMANAIDSLTAVWTGDTLYEGQTLDTSLITVTAHLRDGSTRPITNFSVEGALTMVAGENQLTVRYGNVTGTLTVTAVTGGSEATTLLAEHTTQYGGTSERDRVWFAKHMDAGTYALRITLSEPMAPSTSANALVLKTASVFGETTGTELFVGTSLAMQDKTSIEGTFTLTGPTDGFFLFAKLLKKGVRIRLYVDGAVTDSDLLNITPVASIQGSAAAPGEGWFPVNLAAGTHAYKIDVGGAAESSGNAVVVAAASSMNDKTGAQLLAFTGKQCNGGFSTMDTLTLSEPVSYLYVTYTPSTKSTFTTTLIMV